MRILLLGDDCAELEAVSGGLAAAAAIGDTVEVVADRELVDLPSASPDLVVVWAGDGVGAASRRLQRLRSATDSDDHLPILALTHVGRDEDRQALLTAGATDLLDLDAEPWAVELRARNLLSARRETLRLRRQKERLEVLVRLQRETLSAPPEDLYDHLLRAAVQTVPGAQGGSLLVREDDRFGFCAAAGFDLRALRPIKFSEADMERWHGGGPEGWRLAVPRIHRRDRIDLDSISDAEQGLGDLRLAGRLDQIECNLYLPVVYRGEVLAVLNLDNFEDPSAFDAASLEAVQVFAPTVAALLHELRNRRLLARVAVTDPLTGLTNRRGFDQAVEAELSRARRHGHGFSLLMADLRNFKRINDELGHRQGDQVLIQVARALRGELRQVDVLCRWGGDEFAALLPHTPQQGAAETAQRYAEVVAKTGVGERRLGIDVGVATFPRDGEDAGSLLGIADRRMYRAKASGCSVVADG